MTEKITAYICSQYAGDVTIEPPEKEGIVESDNRVIAYMQPITSQPGCKNGVGKITAYMMETGQDKYCCQDVELTWNRITKNADDTPTGNVYPVINLTTPDHCHWIGSILKFYGTPDISDLVGKIEMYHYPNTGGGECHEDKEDAFGGEDSIDHIVNQNRIIPGMRLGVESYFNDGTDTVVKKSSAKYWCTGSIYGGLITSVNGEYGSESLTYGVTVSGTDIECKSSDFAEYSVGDWVFVGKTACQPEMSGTTCKPDPDDDMMILTLKVNGYGTISRDHEVIEFGLNEVPELFDACVLEGQVIEISDSGDFADIELGELGRKNDIPIFYHCPFCSTTEDGKNAFKEDDVVKVLVTGIDSMSADYCVVGFPDGPRPCVETFYVKVTFNGHEPTIGGERIYFEFPDDPYGDYEKVQTLPLDGVLGPFIRGIDPSVGEYVDGVNIAFFYAKPGTTTTYFDYFYDVATEDADFFGIDRDQTNEYGPGRALYLGTSGADIVRYLKRVKKMRHEQSIFELPYEIVDKDGGKYKQYTANFEIKRIASKTIQSQAIQNCICSVVTSGPFGETMINSTLINVDPYYHDSIDSCDDGTTNVYEYESTVYIGTCDATHDSICIISDENGHTPKFEGFSITTITDISYRVKDEDGVQICEVVTALQDIRESYLIIPPTGYF